MRERNKICNSLLELIDEIEFEEADKIPKTFSSQNKKLGLFTDPRDDQEYRTIELLGNVWLAQNLNFDTGKGCSFYDNDPTNGKKYGRLYSWEAAHLACPEGWRLPTLEEFQALVDNFGGPTEAFEALAVDGVSGFDALLAGVHHPEGDFTGIGKTSSYWTDKEVDEDRKKACFFYFNSSQLVSWNVNLKSHGLSVRCLRSKIQSKKGNK